MSYRHTAKRRDANESIIVLALRAVGATVQQLEQGGGVPDLLVGYQRRTLLIEVKNPDDDAGAKPGGKRTKGRGALTPDQVKWFATWKGTKVIEVISADEALAAIGALFDGCKRHMQRYPCGSCVREVTDSLSNGGVKL